MASASIHPQQVVLITGCSEGGIGHALAMKFAAAEFRVIATGRSLESMKVLELNPNIELLELDVTADKVAIQGLVDGVIAKFGRIDVLVNNAGMYCLGPVAVLSSDLLWRCYKTNIFGVLNLVQAVVPHMCAQGKGKIVNIGSIAAFNPAPWYGGYASSKAALQSITDALRLELRPFGIHVVLVAPGAINTNMAKQASRQYRSLPALKMFEPFRSALDSNVTLTSQASATTSQELAHKILQAVLKEKPPAYVLAGLYSAVASALSYAPSWLRDSFVARASGLYDKQALDQVRSKQKML